MTATVSRSQPMITAPHVPAAFINALAEEGTKDEAIFWLQKQWNETCALKDRIQELEGMLNGAHEFVERHPSLTLIDMAEFEAFVRLPTLIQIKGAE